MKLLIVLLSSLVFLTACDEGSMLANSNSAQDKNHSTFQAKISNSFVAIEEPVYIEEKKVLIIKGKSKPGIFLSITDNFGNTLWANNTVKEEWKLTITNLNQVPCSIYIASTNTSSLNANVLNGQINCTIVAPAPDPIPVAEPTPEAPAPDPIPVAEPTPEAPAPEPTNPNVTEGVGDRTVFAYLNLGTETGSITGSIPDLKLSANGQYLWALGTRHADHSSNADILKINLQNGEVVKFSPPTIPDSRIQPSIWLGSTLTVNSAGTMAYVQDVNSLSSMGLGTSSYDKEFYNSKAYGSIFEPNYSGRTNYMYLASDSDFYLGDETKLVLLVRNSFVHFDLTSNSMGIISSTSRSGIEGAPLVGDGPTIEASKFDLNFDKSVAYSIGTSYAAPYAINDFKGQLASTDLITGNRKVISDDQNGIGPSLRWLDDVVVDLSETYAYVLENAYNSETALREIAIIRVDLNTGDRVIISSNKIGAGPQFINPTAMVLSSDGSTLFVADEGNKSLEGSIIKVILK